ncbi:hypothetical protein [Streptomyces apocyni]|uniref:hypothetical protein n=1 Tax=Streptomyces apocyni TaxID=2654677 RepID=UPI0012EA2EFB|nr:hypothetical protein [Streptomyces apocyni]
MSLPGDRQRPLAALYADAGRLWFQYGALRWDCDAMDVEDVRVRWSEGPDGTGLFTVDGPRGRELAVVGSAAALGPFDPADDWIDALERDFLRWAAERLSDPAGRRALRELYLRGFG